jgi:hypothetical protein
MGKKTKSIWNLYFPGEEGHRDLLFQKINRTPIADFDLSRVSRISPRMSKSTAEKLIRLPFYKVRREKEDSVPFRFINTFFSKSSYLSCILFEKGKTKDLKEILSETKGDKFKVIVECPTGLTMEGEFPADSSLYTVFEESSDIYYSGYETSFNLTKQGDVVPGFHDLYFKKVSVYDVCGTKTLVIKSQTDMEVKEMHPQYGRSVSLFSNVPPEEDDSFYKGSLDDLYADL